MKPFDMVFPGTNSNDGEEVDLTKREYMAVQFMAAILARPDDTTLSDKKAAEWAVHAADTLIEELSK